ncbi:MAG TPA: 50S ribosomal protein L25/general stress protein Ctc [Smithella sp.]|nr:50S ribosomal protein L25/general stress protein Ctc [Smithella sp.]HRS97180.1 50S ribosomal protein L25/general stress protein Ctc [Smithella sp.]
MEVTDLAVQVRHEKKKGPARRLRQDGFVPAVLYGRAADNMMLQVKADDLTKLQKEGKEHAFVKLIIHEESGKKEKLSLIKEMQVEPLSRKLHHVDFYEVDIKRKITMDVPLHFVGKAVGVENGGELQHIKREVKVSCLPLDLPDHIDVDVTNLNIGDSIRVRDLKVAEGITLLDRPDASVAAVAMVKVAKVEAAAAEEGAAEEEAKAEESESGAEAPAEKEKGK